MYVTIYREILHSEGVAKDLGQPVLGLGRTTAYLSALRMFP